MTKASSTTEFLCMVFFTKDTMIRIVSDGVTKSNIAMIRDLAESCIGPNGSFKILQTKAGGYAMTTTSANKLFDFIDVQDPVSQILLSGFTSHCNLFKDGGLFLATLTCNIFIAHSESPLPRQVTCDINNYVQGRIRQRMEEQEISKLLDISRACEMKTFITSILTSKPVCQLSKDEIDHLSIVILKAFFMNSCLKDCTWKQHGLVIFSVEGPSTLQSKIVPGVVLPMTSSGSKNSLSGETFSSCHGCLKIVLITASLAGDQAVIDKSAASTADGSSHIDDVVYNTILQVVDSIVAADVKILCCQKVVHPSIKKRLEEKNILVIERLGHQSMTHLRLAVETEAIESVFSKFTTANIGSIRNIDVLNFFDKRYLVLHPIAGYEFHTMLLCGGEEKTLDELKSLINSVEKSLFHVIKDPRVVSGSGCFETQMANFVRGLRRVDFSNRENSDYQCLLQLSEAKWITGLDNIASSFERIAKALHKINGDCYTDKTYSHLWVFPRSSEPYLSTDTGKFSCCCGSINYVTGLDFESLMFDRADRFSSSCDAQKRTAEEAKIATERSPDVVDLLFLKRECIASAFELSNTILRVGISIETKT